jgi:hypothetical protein
MTRWWESRGAVAAAALGATMPLWFVDLPPLIDLLGHMGRYHIQLNIADSPVLAANWAFRWQWLGNLGGDLLMEPLGRIFGVERGSIIFGALILIVMITGMARLTRAVHGTLPATAWAAFPFAMAYPWQYGLVNYWLGVALAFHAAGWVWPMAPTWRRTTLLGGLSLLLWTAHIYGWAVFAVLIGAQALARMTRQTWYRLPLQLWTLGAPLVPMLALGYGGRGSQETYGWFMWARKLWTLLFSMRDQWYLLDVATLAATGIFLCGAFGSRYLRFDRGLGIAAGILLLAVVIIPFQLLGSAFADGRLWAVVFAVAILAIRPTDDAPPLLSSMIATTAAVIFAVRIAATTVGFQIYDADYARHLKALDHVARGRKIAVFLEFPCEVPWRRPRLDRMDSLAIVRRDAFTNSQWDVPGAQLLTPLGAFGTRYNADPSQLVRRPDCPADLRPELARKIAAFPRDRFDYVWTIGFRPETLPRYAGMTPLFADDRTILYRIDK